MTHKARKNATVDLYLEEPGRARLVVDGIDLSELAYLVEFAMEANHVGRFVISCRSRHLHVHGVADVVDADAGEPPPLRSICAAPAGQRHNLPALFDAYTQQAGVHLSYPQQRLCRAIFSAAADPSLLDLLSEPAAGASFVFAHLDAFCTSLKARMADDTLYE